MKKKILLISLACFLMLPVQAQENQVQKDSTHLKKGKLALIITAETGFYIGGMSYLRYVWYKDVPRVPFHFYNDIKGYMQVDKFGHAFGSYVESYLGYHWLLSAGVSRRKSLIYGATLGMVLQFPIEVFDGLYEGWGFSVSDVAANAVGSGFVIGQELLFREQIMKYKFSFWKSPYRAQSNGYLGNNVLESIFDDYNGHTYWFSVNANKMFLKKKLPDWLNIAVGYGANGMFGEFYNYSDWDGKPIPQTQRYRQYFLSLDVDWTKIKTRSKFLKAVFKGMFFIKLPFPTLELNSLGRLKGHWLYY
jgi:hypothetical protein